MARLPPLLMDNNDDLLRFSSSAVAATSRERKRVYSRERASFPYTSKTRSPLFSPLAWQLLRPGIPGRGRVMWILSRVIIYFARYTDDTRGRPRVALFFIAVYCERGIRAILFQLIASICNGIYGEGDTVNAGLFIVRLSENQRRDGLRIAPLLLLDIIVT